MVRDDEQIPSQETKNEEKKEKEGFRRMDPEDQLKEKEHDQKSCLD